jgi:cardiolipin synthase (CMP-forming)
MPRWLTLANLLTLSRLCLTPYIVSAILHGEPGHALTLLFIAALTDGLDGAVARAFNSTTALGAMLDPIADKCLMSGVFLALGASGSLPWWLVCLVLGRDIYILIAALAIMALTSIRKFPPSAWGKLSTFVQIATSLGWLVVAVHPSALLHAAATALLYLCAIATSFSGIHYTLTGIRTLRSR